jgi:uncharacterized membrane protein YdbT with pleckstrin-like domain
VGVGIIVLLLWWLACLGTKLTVTDRRTILRTGILSKNTDELQHGHVRHIQVSQSIFQRIFGVGRVGLSSADQGGIEIDVSGIPDPQSVRTIVNQHQDWGER